MKHTTKKLLSLLLVLSMLAGLFAVTGTAAGTDNHAPGAPYGLLTNESEYPMNIEGAPRFGWWVSDEDQDEVQTAYQIRLYDGITDEMVWDSGKVESERQTNVSYTGEALKPGYPYSWEVSTWDSQDVQSPFSERAAFATGLEDDDWSAEWIQGSVENTASPLEVKTGEMDVRTTVQGGGMTLQGDSFAWTDYELTVTLRILTGAAGVAFRASEDYQTGYVWQLVPGTGLVRNKVSGGSLTQLGQPVDCEITDGMLITLTIRAEGGTITTTLNGTQIDVYTDEAPISGGAFGLYEEEGQSAMLDSLSARQLQPSKWLKVTGSDSTPFALYNGGYDWENYTVEFDVIIHTTAAAIMLRSADTNSGYMWQFSLAKNGLARHIRTAKGFTKIDGNGAVACTLEAGKQHHASFSINGNVITTYLDGQLIDTYTDSASTYSKGTFGFRAAKGESASFGNVKVTAADGTVLYRETAETVDNYAAASGFLTVTEGDSASYSTDFNHADLAAWVSAQETLPITRESETVYWAESSNDGVVLLNQGMDWTDYTISMDIRVTEKSAGVVFRAPDANNSGYMWAIRSDGLLRLHKGENGKYVRLGTTAESDLPMGIKAGQTYRLTIILVGNTITTCIDGVEVDQRTADVSARGTIGLRTDSNETGQYSNILVLDRKGNVLYADDFSEGAGNWGTGYKGLTAENSYWYSRTEQPLEQGKTVKKALAYVSGSQDYELMVNGSRVGRAQTYDYLGETKYQGWDITDAVQGKDTLTLGVLTSYIGGGQGRAKSMAGLLGQFIVYYTDGTSQTVVTDGTWLTHETGYSNVGARNGEGDEIEYCDGRKMLEGWAESGYDTADWLPVTVHGAHPTPTFYHLQPEIGHVAESEVTAVSVTTLADGTTVADFGKVIPAMVRIHFPDGTAGTKLTVQEGYELKADGSINTASSSTQSTDMRYFYTMKDGEQTFQAWGYLGFRYVSVPAAAGKLTAEDFTATVVHAEVVTGRESTLETSNEMLNQVFEFMKRSGLYSVQNEFVDTPTREKGQFLGDAINISAATMTGSFERQATRKAILQFLDSADRYWSSASQLGMYNAVYPNVDGKRDIPEYSLNLPLLVWRYYMLTGDTELLAHAYPYMKNTADYVTRNTNADTGLVTAIAGGSGGYAQGIVDWPEPGRFGYDWNGTRNGVRTTINALSVRTYDMVVHMAEALGYAEDAANYAAKADALRSAMNTQLITKNGVYADGISSAGVLSSKESQHATSHAIMAGVATDEMIDTMADYIAGLGMRQGPMTADILLEALFDTGRADAAVQLLTNTEDYGWAKLINEGYTFVWEQWQYGQSQSHGWGAASLWQIIENISGVEVVEAGAKTIHIDPAEGAVETVSSHTVTERGPVEISYSGSGADYTITVDIPANVTAEVVFPLVEGGSFAEIHGLNGVNAFTDDAQVMTVGSGKRTFAYVPDEVALLVTGAEETSVSEGAVSYTVSAANMNRLATAFLTFRVSEETLTNPVAEAVGDGWFIILQTYEDGVLKVVLANQDSASGSGDLLKITAQPTGKAGAATLTLTQADLCVYDGEGETFVPADLTRASATTNVTRNLYDVNGDGVVDLLDVTRAQRHYGTDDAICDVNGDGEVNIADLILILNHFTEQ